MLVYVLNQHGEPLMPCSPRKARLLLREKKATLRKRTPFTIQLCVGSSGYKQPITLGVDAGSKHIGLSACTAKRELYAEELTPRNDVVELMSTRREFRRSRRNRKTRYRQPRFNNRVRSKHKGWLAPSVEVKIQEHVTAIKRVGRILPLSKIIVETAEFDMQRLQAMLAGNPLPVGTDYQLGAQHDEYNVRQYVLKRDNYTCQYCGAHNTSKKQVRFHVHHIESRKTGGNAPDNLITLCEHCHDAIHRGLILLPTKRRGRPLRDAAFMGIMRKTFVERLRREVVVPVHEIYGYITKYLREKHKISKSHLNDARCIANAPLAVPTEVYYSKAVRHHNRQLHRATILKGGIRKLNQAPTYIHNFRLFDKVQYEDTECFVWGRRVTGYFLLRNIVGEKIADGVKHTKLNLLERGSNYLIQRRTALIP